MSHRTIAQKGDCLFNQLVKSGTSRYDSLETFISPANDALLDAHSDALSGAHSDAYSDVLLDALRCTQI